MPDFVTPLYEHGEPKDPDYPHRAVGVQSLELRDLTPQGVVPVGQAHWYSFPAQGQWKAALVKRVPGRALLGFDAEQGWQRKFAFLRHQLRPPDPPRGYEVIYRIGSSGALAGRNAANLEGLARFLDQEGGDFAADVNFADATVYMYFAKLGPTSGAYLPTRRARRVNG